MTAHSASPAGPPDSPRPTSTVRHVHDVTPTHLSQFPGVQSVHTEEALPGHAEADGALPPNAPHYFQLRQPPHGPAQPFFSA